MGSRGTLYPWYLAENTLGKGDSDFSLEATNCQQSSIVMSGKVLKESQHSVVERFSAFKLNEMSCVAECSQLSSRNAASQQAAVFRRY